ncbi:MAG: hypothetical protein H7Z18_04455 [Methylophilaceae bacterium]|nr:hypothetical protein [Methylophilaceae bacterium]
MNSHLETLRQTCVNFTAAKNGLSYRALSPQLEFGIGDTAMQHRLITLDELQADDDISDPADGINNGWIALETAAHLPPGLGRQRHVSISQGRFSRIAAGVESRSSTNRLAAHAANLGLAVVSAYQYDAQTLVDDNPGYYASLLERALHDELLMKHQETKRRGNVSELTVATLASHLNYFTLPTSTRHDQPLSSRMPSFAYDLQIWFEPPNSLPTRPDRKIQVKTTYSTDCLRYAAEISLVSICDDFVESHLDQLATALTRLYSGKTVNNQSARCIQTNGAILTAILEKEEAVTADSYSRVRRILAMRS